MPCSRQNQSQRPCSSNPMTLSYRRAYRYIHTDHAANSDSPVLWPSRDLWASLGCGAGVRCVPNCPLAAWHASSPTRQQLSLPFWCFEAQQDGVALQFFARPCKDADSRGGVTGFRWFGEALASSSDVDSSPREPLTEAQYIATELCRLLGFRLHTAPS